MMQIRVTHDTNQKKNDSLAEPNHYLSLVTGIITATDGHMSIPLYVLAIFSTRKL
jgi:hypothetical protein